VFLVIHFIIPGISANTTVITMSWITDWLLKYINSSKFHSTWYWKNKLINGKVINDKTINVIRFRFSPKLLMKIKGKKYLKLQRQTSSTVYLVNDKIMHLYLDGIALKYKFSLQSTPVEILISPFLCTWNR
jgi:hypothetical protein